jgi:hypothetical protein
MDGYIQALVTFVAGLVALDVYVRQKIDRKKDAARVLAVEIAGAEDRIKALKIKVGDSGGTDIGKDMVLSSDSWAQYRHLFIKDFTDKQWRKINDFYEECASLNDAIKENNSYFGQNSQAMRAARYSAAASFITSAIIDVEAGKFNIEQPDGTLAISSTAEADVKKRVNLEIGAFNEILQETVNVANVHYNPMKPVNDTERTLKFIETNLSDSDIGIKLRKIANKKVYLWF